MDDSALAPLLYNSKAIAWPQERSDIKLNWLNWIVLTVFWFLACKKGERVRLSALQILRCIVWSRRWLVPSNSSIIRAGGCSVINKKYGWFIVAVGGWSWTSQLAFWFLYPQVSCLSFVWWVWCRTQGGWHTPVMTRSPKFFKRTILHF